MGYNTAEKIETIVLSRSSGAFGTFREYGPGRYRVEADGLTVLVRSDIHGWYVAFNDFEAIGADLYDAVKRVLEAGYRG